MSDAPKLDQYGRPYHIPAKWSRHLDGDDDGFPVTAFPNWLRTSFPSMCTLGTLLLEFNRNTYDNLVLWYKQSQHEKGLTFVPRKEWIDELVLTTYIPCHVFDYTDPKTGEVHESATLEELGISINKYRYRHHLSEGYTIANIVTSGSKSIKSFIYVDEIPTKVVEVNPLEVSVSTPDHPVEEHQPQVEEYTKEQQALIVLADTDKDGVVEPEEIAAIDTNQDKVLTEEEVQINLNLPETEFKAALDEVYNAIDQLQTEVVPTFTIPEDVQVPTPEEIMNSDTYRPEETAYTNMLIKMLHELNQDANVNVMEFILRTIGVMVLNPRQFNLKVLSTAVSMVISKIKGNGQLELKKETYVGEGKPLTEEQFDVLQTTIQQCEERFEEQKAYLHSIQEQLQYVNDKDATERFLTHPDVKRFEERLTDIERTYVRL